MSDDATLDEFVEDSEETEELENIKQDKQGTGDLQTLETSPIDEWKLQRLGEVLSFEYGDNLPADTRQEGKIPVYGSNGQVDTHTEANVDRAGIIIGRKGSIGEGEFSDEPFWAIDTTYYISNEETSENLRFIYYLLQDMELERLNAASAIPGLNRNDAYNLNTLVPPLSEQRKIATVLHTVDQAIQKTEESIEQKSRVKRGVMQDLLTGKIRTYNKDITVHEAVIPDNRPANDISMEDKGRTSKQINEGDLGEGHALDELVDPDNPASVERVETPIGELPADWTVEWLDSICSINPEGFSENDWPDETFEYVSLSDVSEGRILQTETIPVDDAPSRAQRRIRKNDVLVGTVRPKQVSHGFVTGRHDGDICSSGFGVLRPSTSLNPHYLLQEVLSRRFFRQMEAYVAGSGYPAVKISDLRKHRIAVPPLEEQRKIASALYTMDKSIKSEKKYNQQLQRLKQGLMQDLLSGDIRTHDKDIEILDEVIQHG